jgi:hypothetical protein
MVLISKEAYELPDVYRFNGPLERDGQNLAFAGLRHLVMGAASARRRADHSESSANDLNIGNPPASSRVLGHLVQNVSHLYEFPGFSRDILNQKVNIIDDIYQGLGTGNPVRRMG